MERVKRDVSLGPEIHIEDITQRTIALIGQKGSGKTTAIRSLGRVVSYEGLPVLILDPTGAAKSDTSFNIVVTKRNRDPELLMKIILRAWDMKEVLVVDLSDLNREEVSELGSFIFPEMLRHLQDGVVMVDEMPDFTPQFGKFKSEELIRFNRKCRNRNIGFVFASQRPATVSKDVLALADVMMIMRVAWPADMDSIEKSLQRKYQRGEVKDILNRISQFRAGDTFIIDFRA